MITMILIHFLCTIPKLMWQQCIHFPPLSPCAVVYCPFISFNDNASMRKFWPLPLLHRVPSISVNASSLVGTLVVSESVVSEGHVSSCTKTTQYLPRESRDNQPRQKQRKSRSTKRRQDEKRKNRGTSHLQDETDVSEFEGVFILGNRC
jgi:hypothetical protein